MKEMFSRRTFFQVLAALGLGGSAVAKTVESKTPIPVDPRMEVWVTGLPIPVLISGENSDQTVCVKIRNLSATAAVSFWENGRLTQVLPKGFLQRYVAPGTFGLSINRSCNVRNLNQVEWTDYVELEITDKN